MENRIGLAPLGGATTALARAASGLVVLLALSMTLVWTSPAVAADPTVEVTIDNFTFTPATITIEPGTTVKWLNRDDIPHTVAATSLAFKSRALDTDDSFSHQFTEVGVIDYFCSLHPHMTGKVIVSAHEK